MKQCPQCGREYDPSMMFCLDDGAELLYGPAPMGEPATAILSEPRAVATGLPAGDESATRADIFPQSGEAEPPASFGNSPERQSLSAHRAAEPQEVLSVHRAKPQEVLSAHRATEPQSKKPF